MGKIHLLLKKEELDHTKIESEKIVIVFDVLLATSTIVAALDAGAKEVIPVTDRMEALKEAEGRLKGSYCLVGEWQGKTLDGFLSPSPLALQNEVRGKVVILSTTNGTVAIKKSSMAKRVYIAALLNGAAIAGDILEAYTDETIVIVCSGSSGEFNVEDFYGAGYVIDNLLNKRSFELTDSAIAAQQFYIGAKNIGHDLLSRSRVGQLLKDYGLDDDLHFVSKKGEINVVALLEDGKTVISKGTTQIAKA